MPHIGGTELLIIGIVAVTLFGYKKLPEMGRGLGQAIKNFRRSMHEEDEIDITKHRRADGNDHQDKDR